MSFNVIGIGEVLWDLLPSGPQIGGAPANFAYHAHALGARAQVITRVGNDQRGHEIIHHLEEMGLPSNSVQVDESAPTGTVTVRLAANGIPEYTIHENTAWDRITVTPEALTAVRSADALCFGSLAQRSPVSRQSIERLVSAASASAWRVFDINLRQRFYTREIIERSLQLASVFKLNADELPVLAEMFGLARTAQEQMEALADAFGLRAVVLTRGGGGSLIYRQGRWSDQKSAPVKIVDTVGAGDSFTAALVMGLLHNQDLDAVHEFAAEVAGCVCSWAGATPPLPEKLRNHFTFSSAFFTETKPPFGSKVNT
jgi:fructokinase